MAGYGARSYDRFMSSLERMGLRGWRQQLLRHVEPPVLEVGIGTGASLRWYNGRSPLIAIDREREMARAALERAFALGSPTAIVQMDAQYLAFSDATFASVVTSLVFCSVADPLRGLREIRRVLRPGGRLYMLEHVRPDHPVLGPLADLLNVPWHAFTQECHLNRRTAHNVVAAGFRLESAEKRLWGAVNLIVARS
jgi:phosphatidylethanolamine/phosphatidyl-N-methylethanolamine N-methyltransferase